MSSIGMNSELMSKYIEYVGDRLALQLVLIKYMDLQIHLNLWK